MINKRNFLVVEDEALIREGLCSLLKTESFVKNIFEAADRSEFQSAMENRIDVILLDFKLKDTNGLELLKIIKNRDDKIKVIAITGLEGTELLLNLLKAGVNGIVYKLDGYKEIRKTIEKILDGESHFSEKVLTIIQKNAHLWENVPSVTLTFSENELLNCVAKGLTTKAISVKLKMTEATIETYRHRLMKKVGASNTAALLAFAYRNGLL
jgi:DNA-binding NarL/FixJ family response regulator